MKSTLVKLESLVTKYDGINDKSKLTSIVQKRFDLIRDRSVYYRQEFAIRFCKSTTRNLGNTVLSLSNLKKYDDRPFIVCVVTPTKNHLLLANSSFLKKISHSSQELSLNNIKGSFNGSDIVKLFNEKENESTNFDYLFRIHEQIGFDGNFERLVEATLNIQPFGEKPFFTAELEENIFASPERTIEFIGNDCYKILKKELDDKIKEFNNEILIAALINNTNIRGAVIEYLITGEDAVLLKELSQALLSKKENIPSLERSHELGDYIREFENYNTRTDVKTKVMILRSNPKAYNIDKMLHFLSEQNSVFMLYFVGLGLSAGIKTALTSMFQKELCNSTIILRHWAGRNSRGVTQFDGDIIEKIILNPNNLIDETIAKSLLNRFLTL
ncbi:MAG: hypothetical protein PHC50_01915 [Candidatus Cloacimonetes bacterium]|nr:hypothetical protein [Candidatus Cloacimonadota bacterium]